MAEPHEKYSFQNLRRLPIASLLDELTDTFEALANLHEEIAYLRAGEKGQPDDWRQERIIKEGARDALIERKFLLARLIDQLNQKPMTLGGGAGGGGYAVP